MDCTRACHRQRRRTSPALWGACAVGPGQRRSAQRPLSAPHPLSADSQDILAYVDQPLQARKPVGYQRDFLEAYQPNGSAYLSEPLRRQLRKMGRTAQAH